MSWWEEWRYTSTALNLGTRWSWVASFLIQSLYSKERSLDTDFIRGWVGPKGWYRRCGEVKNLLLLPGMEYQFAAHGPATVLRHRASGYHPQTTKFSVTKRHSLCLLPWLHHQWWDEGSLITLPSRKHNCKTYNSKTPQWTWSIGALPNSSLDLECLTTD
jgi:hypothetical protein